MKNAVFVLVVACVLTGCAAPEPISTAAALPPAITAEQPRTSAVSPSPTPDLLPDLTLRPGDLYFRLDGTPGLIFSRNIAGTNQVQYQQLFDWTKAGGSRFVRLSLDNLGMGYTNRGAVDPNWAAQWDQILDKAEADGVYALPTFSTWFDWNAGVGYSTWKSNPLSVANGGPAEAPDELLQKDSETQALWLAWMQSVVKRWKGRHNILAWEIFSEVNLVSGATETAGIDFVNRAAASIRSADPMGRPVTASLAETGTWPKFYRDTSIDFINVHPYPPSGELDRTVISMVHNALAAYRRPVLIGESGLSAATPDTPDGKLTVAPNASIGIRHAIWAGMVSGAMNGRSLWWEDGVGIYFPALGTPWLEKYATEELAPADFVSGVDFSGFTPLTVSTSSGVWGAAVGNDRSVIGWFRDASSEPPTWDVEAVVSDQTITLTVPGSAASWQVDFYSTKTGTEIVSSTLVTRDGRSVTVPLPDFKDDIAFKMYAQD